MNDEDTNTNINEGKDINAADAAAAKTVESVNQLGKEINALSSKCAQVNAIWKWVAVGAAVVAAVGVGLWMKHGSEDSAADGDGE